MLTLHPRSPDFIGIGAQKAGTCWLRANLARHPDLWMPPVSELHYFDRSLPGSGFPSPSALQRAADEPWRTRALQDLQSRVAQGDLSQALWSALAHFVDHDDGWYRSLFAWASPAAVVGEITPRYALCGDPEIAHMRAVAPEAKLIFLLRHPVDRFWSQCRMKHADGSLPPDDASAMRLFASANGRPRGDYSTTILRYCRHFDPSQILLIFTEAIQHSPVAVLEGLHAFLGLAPIPVDPQLAGRPVNASANPSPMPSSLRARISAACRFEIETLAAVFGGPASAWLEDGPAPQPTPAMFPLSASHVTALRQRHRQPLGLRSPRPDPLFCISMQRSGTTTVGDWLESHGLVRAGHPTSARLRWTLHWFRGEYEAIFDSPEFQAADVFEDDPWWCPDFYKLLAHRFPNARFILLTRHVNAWFDSLCHHSGGRNPGPTALHARIYRREHDLQALLQHQPHTDPLQPGLLSILHHEAHYKSIYLRHNAESKQFFAAMPKRLFTGALDSPQTLLDLCAFVGVDHNPAIAIPRSNARTAAMVQNLAQTRALDR